jgi:hypothetical protein
MKFSFAQCLMLALVACSSGSSGTSSTTTGGNGGLPPGYVGDDDAGTCTPAPGYTGNSKHVGAFCTQGGGQCYQWGNLFCSADVDPAQGDFWCLLQCTSDADCGEDSCCHVDTQNHTSNMACIPIGCVADAGACF